jgi:hypothetical protein
MFGVMTSDHDADARTLVAQAVGGELRSPPTRAFDG